MKMGLSAGNQREQQGLVERCVPPLTVVSSRTGFKWSLSPNHHLGYAAGPQEASLRRGNQRKRRLCHLSPRARKVKQHPAPFQGTSHQLEMGNPLLNLRQSFMPAQHGLFPRGIVGLSKTKALAVTCPHPWLWQEHLGTLGPALPQQKDMVPKSHPVSSSSPPSSAFPKPPSLMHSQKRVPRWQRGEVGPEMLSGRVRGRHRCQQWGEQSGPHACSGNRPECPW